MVHESNSSSAKHGNNTTGYLHTTGYLYTTTEKTFILIFMLLLTLTSILGNVFVFIAYFKTKALQKATNHFILSLAAADLLVAVFIINIYTMYMVLDYWPIKYLNYTVCVVWLAADYWIFQVSVFGVITIAGDRWVLIHYDKSSVLKSNVRPIYFFSTEYLNTQRFSYFLRYN